MLKNKYVQSALLFLGIVGGYIVAANVFPQLLVITREGVSETSQTVQESDVVAGDTKPTAVMDRNMEVVATSSEKNIDLTGTHIMPNGDVMTGAGVIIPDAVIQDNGEIKLNDGTVITPVMDLRR